MNVLSLFDGISCGRLALDRAGIHYDNYFASEIDPYALKIAGKHFPTNINLGDVNTIDPFELPMIDLLIAGSPCQGFSVGGKGLNFNDPRSSLFFKFVELLNILKPTYFLLENVRMKEEWEAHISHYVGRFPICINSSLVSAQNRQRLYWTNIPNVVQPKDKYIYLEDILETNGFTDRNKSYCLDANYAKGISVDYYLSKCRRQIVFEYDRNSGFGRELKKVIGLLASNYKGLNRNQKQNAVIDTTTLNYRKLSPIECERLQTLPDNYTEGVSNSQRYKMTGNCWTVDVIAHIFKNLPNKE